MPESANKITDTHTFDGRCTGFLSTGYWYGIPSNTDYQDLRNSTGQGPMSRLPSGGSPTFVQWFFNKSK